MKTVRIKMQCTAITNKEEGITNNEAVFHAVTEDTVEDKSFFEATPNAYFTVAVLKEQHFEVGKKYYMDITLAE